MTRGDVVAVLIGAVLAAIVIVALVACTRLDRRDSGGDLLEFMCPPASPCAPASTP